MDPHNELQGTHQWLIMLWKREVLTKEQMVALPYASDCDYESDYSITSTGLFRRRKPSMKHNSLVAFATAFLKGRNPESPKVVHTSSPYFSRL